MVAVTFFLWMWPLTPAYIAELMFHVCLFLFFLFSATDLLLAWNPVCLGLVEGLIGKIQLHAGTVYRT